MSTELISNILGNVFFQTWLGAVCAHLLSLYSDEFKGTIPFVKKLIPNKSETFYFRIDFLILPLIGALLAYVLLDPASLKASIFAGLSWSGTLIAMLKKNNTEIESSENE
ncbi:hypothetical protein INQ45_06595 [Flavobacterium columnare]|uniref:hypothetical protein n=1 Tax=Flavobacterium columnare TaxID=996 RepID=UPI002D206814|nr:hypothetical protein [Flavobacterium columnare]MEB3800748.1 hypothetical protein [Flavobacterium columnare]